MTDTVVIAGAGPNGLMLACELALAGVPVVVLERNENRVVQPKANGLAGQVVRLLDHRGLYQRYLGEDEVPSPASRYIFGGFALDLSLMDDNPFYVMLIPQRELEALLERRAAELGVELRRGHELTDFSADDTGVTVHIAAGRRYRERAAYLVGADGSRSLVRKHAGIAFPGTTLTDTVSRVAHVSLPAGLLDPGKTSLHIPGFGEAGFGFTRTDTGVFNFAVLDASGPIVGTIERDPHPPGDDVAMSLDELRDSIRRVLGVDLPLSPPTSPGPHHLRRNVTTNTRIAEHYRRGRVLLVGDAAHVHSAVGGPGLNLGLQDAVNLGWKLAAELSGRAPVGLLDTYHAERHPVGERVMVQSLAQLALLAPGAEVNALRRLMGDLFTMDRNLEYIARTLAGSDVRYPTRDGHRLSGRFTPDFTVTTATGPRRVAELTRRGKAVLVDLSPQPRLARVAAGWSDRVELVEGTAANPPAAALLIRPDGYVAWACDDPAAEPAALEQALRDWFGAPDREPATTGSGVTPPQ